uniref:Phosphatase PP2A regulatory subunit A/Splicing factor 3B subunit 1-like HEAT repeat domain-containing protein n=1 Tax=Quercus lobata TaxID=97700 RepID=A0A7N2MKM0_QUELO
MTSDELKERKIMKLLLLLKVKNGTPPQRKMALRQLTGEERHLLVKVIDRVLYKLDELVRPYVHKILVVIEPLLIDENYYARVEGTPLQELSVLGFLLSCPSARLSVKIVNALGQRVKPCLPQICDTIKWRLNDKSAKVRQQAADLISRIAVVMKQCYEEQLMGHLGVVLYEYLGEEYPEVLGLILGALKAIVNVISTTKMTSPIKDLLPRLTPILKNRHGKWMRICFELLEMLKAHKKGIRRATVNTFGCIAKAIGPQDVLATLLNNLKVQERQNRVCTTVAIAIVAETCSPFTVPPALMNEYRVPELNVQNVHLLNYVWPNIFETSPHVINAVMEAIEGIRLALGAVIVLNYCLQGLFHHARKFHYTLESRWNHPGTGVSMIRKLHLLADLVSLNQCI